MYMVMLMTAILSYILDPVFCISLWAYTPWCLTQMQLPSDLPDFLYLQSMLGTL